MRWQCLRRNSTSGERVEDGGEVEEEAEMDEVERGEAGGEDEGEDSDEEEEDWASLAKN